MSGVVQDGIRGENPKDGVLANLCFWVQLLASPGADQLAHFPDPVCPAAEMVSEYDHWTTSVPNYWELSAQQTARLSLLTAHLAILDDETHNALWADEALLRDPYWIYVRHAAREILTAFGWPVEVPPPARYVTPTSP